MNFHELEWRKFAHDRKLPTTRDDKNFYVNPKTREAHAAWVQRSRIEASSNGPRAYHNAALEAASSAVFKILTDEGDPRAVELAKAIQALRIDVEDKDG